tara:strand:- start:2738 stop:3379 length:642 start_codon:yes stop_codon:yes gene_type:complete
MAAGLGFKTFVSGDVLTAADTNGYLMQGVLVFATTTARDAAITSPQEGQFAFTKDADSLFYYDGSSWVASSLAADITGVTAGTAISGGGTSGTVTVNVDVNSASTVTATSSDYILISDVTDNSTKKALISDVVATGDITAIVTASNSSLAGGTSSGSATLTVSTTNTSTATAVAGDYVLIEDVSDNTTKKALISDIVSLVPDSDPIPLILALS